MQPNAWWRNTSLALVAVAAVLPAGMRAVAGPPGATVHVRWHDTVDGVTRATLESDFRLADAERLDATTWRYDLLDTSPDNIRALGDHAAVADTHGIDRPAAAIDRAAERTGRRQRFVYGPIAVATADIASILLTLAALTLIALGVRGHAATPRSIPSAVTFGARGLARTLTSVLEPAARFVSRGIPVIDAFTAGVFRIVFGMLALMVVLARPVDAARLATVFKPNIQDDLHAVVFEWLSGQPAVADAITPWLIVTGLAVIAGLYTRVAYALFAAGVVLWGFAAVAFDSTHPHATFLLATVGLLPSRWGDALSLDSRLRTTRPLPPSQRYGYSVWLPGLVFGVAFAAAACAKLDANGLDWILNGTVKYHFVVDSRNAAVDWGLQLARYPALAVMASFAAILVELMVLPAAFMRSERYRCIAGLAGAALLAGFRLFMGVFWRGWWTLLLGFLPWQSLARRWGARRDPAWTPTGRATAAQSAVVVAIVVQQIVVSVVRTERAPFFSHYPMYANTYSNPEAFNAATATEFRIIVTRHAERISLSCNPDEDLVDDFRAALDGSAAAVGSVWKAVLGCRPDLRDATAVTFEQSSRQFDWATLKFADSPPTVIGTLAAPALDAR